MYISLFTEMISCEGLNTPTVTCEWYLCEIYRQIIQQEMQEEVSHHFSRLKKGNETRKADTHIKKLSRLLWFRLSFRKLTAVESL